MRPGDRRQETRYKSSHGRTRSLHSHYDMTRAAAQSRGAVRSRLPGYRSGISFILPPRLPAVPTFIGAHEWEAMPFGGNRYGYSALRLKTVAPRSGRVVHRRGLAGPDHRSARAGAAAFGPRAFRARRAHPLAHPSARPDIMHSLRHRPGADLGRTGARSPRRRRGLDSAE